MHLHRPVAIGAAVAGGIVVAVLVLAALVGWGGDKASAGAARDQRFLSLTVYDDTLSAADVSTRIELGHQMCSLLDRFHGDATRAGAVLARGYESTFTPLVLSSLQRASTDVYCPQWRS